MSKLPNREGKGERDRRGGRRKGGQEHALPIKKSSRAPARKRQFFQYRIRGKDSNISFTLVGSCCSLALIYLVVSVLRALDGSGKLVVGGRCLQLLGGDCRPWAHSELAGSLWGNTTEKWMVTIEPTFSSAGQSIQRVSFPVLEWRGLRPTVDRLLPLPRRRGGK